MLFRSINSPLYELLKANRKIRAWIGAEKSDSTIEWVPLGVFWSGDWNVPEQGLFAQTSGRDRLEQLRRSTYSSSQVEINKTLYNMAKDVLEDAGLVEEEYIIDLSLQDIIIPYAFLGTQSHREALRVIAEASLSQVYCDRNGVVNIATRKSGEGILFAEFNVDDDMYLWQSGNISSGISYELIDGYLYLISEQGLTKDEYFTKDNPIKWSQIANRVELEIGRAHV